MTQQTPVEHYPFDAKVSVDAETNQRLISNLSERFSQPRLNVHVSDLDLCLRQSVFKKVAPKPVTGKELGFFSAGRGHHDCLEGLHGAEREVAREWEGIKAHYDLLDKTVLEIKTTRSFNRNVAPHYIRRLAYYLAIEGQLLGKLIIMYLMPVRASKKNPKPPQDFIETYNVRFPDLEVIRTTSATAETVS